MKIICPHCRKQTEIEHVERGRHVECVCSKRFTLNDTTVIEDYSQIDEAPPEFIGQYKIRRFIGRGGMGRVYKSTHPQLGIPVAVKTLLGEYAENTDFKERFIKSTKICAMLNHPNIVKVYDCGFDGTLLYLVMEYIGGGSTQDILDTRGGPLPTLQVAQIAQSVSRGLVEAQKYSIVHRDIKPENIMRGTDGVFKLSDLGLAKIHSPGEDASKDKFSITMDSVGLGTPQYMSPEQSVDAKNCDSRADIYSLGITLYQLATGRLPFISNDPIELRRMHASEKPPMPSELNSEIDPDFEHIICKCIEKSRSDRYQTPDELLADIDAYIDRLPLPSLAAVSAEKEHADKSQQAPPPPPGRKTITQSVVFKLTAASVATAIVITAACILYIFMHEIFSRNTAAKPQTELPALPLPDNKQSPMTDDIQPEKKDSEQAQVIQDKNYQARIERQKQLWQFAEKYAEDAKKQSANFDIAITNFKAFAEDESNSSLAKTAAERISELRNARNAAVAAILTTLANEAKQFLDSRQYAKAASVYENYHGRLEQETAQERRNIAQAYNSVAARNAAKLIRDMAGFILQADYSAALELYRSQNGKSSFPELEKTLSELKDIPLTFAENLKQKINKVIYITLGQNSTISQLRIRSIEPPYVNAEESPNINVVIMRKFTISDMRPKDQEPFLASVPTEVKALWLGPLFLKFGDRRKASEYFDQAGIFSPIFNEIINESDPANLRAKAKLLEILAASSFKVRELPAPQNFTGLAIWDAMTKSDAQKASASLSAFLASHAKTKTADDYRSAITAVMTKLSEKYNSNQ